MSLNPLALETAFMAMRDEIDTLPRHLRPALEMRLNAIGRQVIEERKFWDDTNRRLDGERRRLTERRNAALKTWLEITSKKGFDPTGCHVYVLWGDDDERPLYVGQSTNILSRLGSHLSDPKKRRAVRRVTVLPLAANKMDAVEAELIALHRPVWNVRLVPTEKSA